MSDPLDRPEYASGYDDGQADERARIQADMLSLGHSALMEGTHLRAVLLDIVRGTQT